MGKWRPDLLNSHRRTDDFDEPLEPGRVERPRVRRVGHTAAQREYQRPFPLPRGLELLLSIPVAGVHRDETLCDDLGVKRILPDSEDLLQST